MNTAFPGSAAPGSMDATQRKMPIGAEPLDQGVHFRVWAPRAKNVVVTLEHQTGPRQCLPLAAEADGYFSGFSTDARAGTLYRYQLDNQGPYPDPASRFQPEGPHGASEVIDADAFQWSDAAWTGPQLTRPLIYELHVGTFTPEGTWRAAQERLPYLADLGVTLIEVMPVADFSGRFGWGYDGVNLYAPSRLYGRPDDLRSFVDAAHAVGVGVILDVVYNHFGPDGCYLRAYSDDYFSREHTTDWGDAINFGGPAAAPVREYFLSNASYWIREFHLDGLRLDATQNIYDDTRPGIITEAVQRVRAAAGRRRTFVVGENEPQAAWLLKGRAEGGAGLDALWNDDFHHTARVALTGETEAYYTDYRGTPQELVSACKWGFLYQGQHYIWQAQRRGSPVLDLEHSRFVHFLENHDQVANSSAGLRLHQLSSPGRMRALTALLLLAPSIPMLFQGQEFASSAPFLFFADHKPELARLVKLGRKQFLSQFASLATAEAQRAIPDPVDPATFQRCHLDWSEVERKAHVLALHRDLIRLSRSDATLRAAAAERLQGAVLSPAAFLLRFFGEQGDDRLLLVNLGRQFVYGPAPEPLLAAPERRIWSLIWSSEEPRYRGTGTPPVERVDGWHLPAGSALLLAARPDPAHIPIPATGS